MKTKLLSLIIIVSFFGCKDQPENEERAEDINPQNEYISDAQEEKTGEPENNIRNTSDKDREKETDPLLDMDGSKYVKTDQQQDARCNCYCLDLNLAETTELCLAEDEIYINSRLVKSGNEVQVFYAGPSERNTNEDLPWDKFDENEPVAILTPGPNGNLELDWKGFTIDGELAVDYAIYGKKTLEGTYTKR